MEREARGMLVAGLAALFYAARVARDAVTDDAIPGCAKKSVDHAEALIKELEKRGHVPADKAAKR